jgi:hypothetical protein
MNARTNFIYAPSPYRGRIEPRYVAFDAWLQQFAQRVSYICCLETSGKLPAEEAYRQLNCLSKQLKRNRPLVKPGPGRVSSRAATTSPPAQKEAGSRTPAVCPKLGGIRR